MIALAIVAAANMGVAAMLEIIEQATFAKC
jgi:hypothetical protein